MTENSIITATEFETALIRTAESMMHVLPEKARVDVMREYCADCGYHNDECLCSVYYGLLVSRIQKMTKNSIITAAEFAAFTPYAKGYAVYMCGDRSDQPNVPHEYTPSPETAADFNRGTRTAILEITESGG